jgi:hypothetical protein
MTTNDYLDCRHKLHGANCSANADAHATLFSYTILYMHESISVNVFPISFLRCNLQEHMILSCVRKDGAIMAKGQLFGLSQLGIFAQRQLHDARTVNGLVELKC